MLLLQGTQANKSLVTELRSHMLCSVAKQPATVSNVFKSSNEKFILKSTVYGHFPEAYKLLDLVPKAQEARQGFQVKTGALVIWLQNSFEYYTKITKTVSAVYNIRSQNRVTSP